MLELGTIVRSLAKRKTIAILIAVQMAVVIAILLNIYIAIVVQIKDLNRPSGIDHENSFYISTRIAETGATSETFQSIIDSDLTYIRGLPEVVAAVQSISIPFSGSGSSMGIDHDIHEGLPRINVTHRTIDEHGLETFGLDLLSGRNFLPEEITWAESWGGGSDIAIISEDLASLVFPDNTVSEVLGLQITVGGGSYTIIGVVSNCHGPWQSEDQMESVLYVPVKHSREFSTYLIRTLPGELGKTLRTLETELPKIYPNRLVRNVRTIIEARTQLYVGSIATIWILGATSFALLFVVICGIIGIVNFALRRRRNEIGIRRALGATPSNIVQNILTEYAMIAGTGIIVGAALAIGLNILMVSQATFPKLGWVECVFVPVFALAVALVAVWLPTRKANQEDPASVIRSL